MPANHPLKYRGAAAIFLIAFVMLAVSTAQCVPANPNVTVTHTPTARPAATRTPQNPVYFQFETGQLLVTTKLLELKLEGGAVTFIKDRASGEILVDGGAFTNRPADTAGFVGFTFKQAGGSERSKAPAENSPAVFEITGANTARLTYSNLGGSQAEMSIEITVEETTGEVILQLTGREASPGAEILSIDLPIVNVTANSVILGSGAIYNRADAAAQDQTTYVQYGLYSPTAGVIQNERAVAAFWSETTQFDPEYIRLDHSPASDQLILHGEHSALQTDPAQIISPPWRIGTYPTWLAAAKRWRETFEARTGAKPLWENRSLWVRKLHAVYDSTVQEYGADKQKYASLASQTPPEKTLFFLWNGDRIVLFGDHTQADQIARPSPAALALIQSYGWPLLLYHPYTLIYSEQGAAERIQKLSEQGWLPAGYEFNPDYAGTAQDWQKYWAAVKTDYGEGLHSYVIHPGAAIFKEYLLHNFKAYTEKYLAQGAYFDILGANEDYKFAQDKKIIEGQNYVLGEINTMQEISVHQPGLAVMSEYQTPWLIPFVFFSWEGSSTHLQQNSHAHSRINHPFRTALIGSYTWARESNEQGVDEAASALLGTLPQISMPGDSGISDEVAARSQARASLFCSEELFNDLPETWQAGALAYYRSALTGRWFVFKQVSGTYEYIEILEDGTEIIRLAEK